MWRMMRQEEPDDYVIATGKSHSAREFAERAFATVGLDWEKYVEVDERFYRPTDICELRGDASKARSRLGWASAVDFEAIGERTVKADLEGLANPAGPR
jgi:GDPmannose 4,6-dehydratase